MSKLTNLFEDFRDYKAKNVDSPSYEPLKQKILDKDDIMRIVDREEIRKAKKREYNKKYNANRSEEKKARDRELRRKYYEEHKDDHKIPEKAQKTIRQRIKDPNEPTELQMEVYNYMLEKYKETGKIPRVQQIARDFGKTDASIYSVLALLVKKGKLYKGARGQLYFTSDYERKESEMVYVEENKSELEQISDFMDYMVYTVFTKDNIELECVLRREQESISPIFRWEGTVNWVMSKPRGDSCGSKHTLWLTDKGDLEFCISQMNDYIKDNFKTKLG